ncbi:hypothetical protein N9B82_05625 [Saprospiraceae bacterium]|nr:hypothetical protein [Saprospiraceae bacterium]
MRNVVICLLVLLFFLVFSCTRENFEVEIPDFDFPQTIVFENSLSAYGIFEGSAADLVPAEEYELLELSSILFTDYAQKQRLINIPEGAQMIRLSDGSIDFPDGTILTKTFFYYKDERDETLGKRIIETRLLIKESNTWNIATYLWNEAQTDASLELDGLDTQVSWVNSNGDNLSTLYHVPDENECIACHQSNSTMIPLGTKLRNLNRMVERNSLSLNQISHLQSVGILNDFEMDQVSEIVDYTDETYSLSERGRAYLELNCAHCHNPTAWAPPTEREFDFRYETALSQSGILFEEDKIKEALLDREMPFIGTTILDQEGVDLVVEYIESL